MAENNKQLGTLQLNKGNVMQVIEEVNKKLKELGKGVDLDLTHLLNAKVNSQIAELKKQIDEVSKARTGASTAQKQQIREAAALMTEMINKETQMVKSGATDALVAQYNKRKKSLEGYSQAVLEQAEKQKNVITATERLEQANAQARKKAQEQIAQSYEQSIRAAQKSLAEAEKAQAQEERRIQKEVDANQRAAEKITAAQQKAAAEKAKINQQAEAEYQKALERQVEEAQRKEERETAMTLSALEQRTAAVRKAYQDQIQAASQNLQEQYRLQAQIVNIGNDPSKSNERSALESQLASLRQAYSQYSANVRAEAEKNANVIRAKQDLIMTKAKQRDAQDQANFQKEKQRMQERQQLLDRWANAMVTKVGGAAQNLIKTQLQEAIEYATTYYDKLNEIRVVTGKSEDDAARMGAKFRELAQEMKVTSTELASAAVTFYRQGLNDTEVNDRLNWVTKYAKIANIDFETAAELITASANAMSADIQGDIERVVDVFLYLGDAAATSGEEIGKAMQKASASATEFGLSFEWLGSYIATVAEQTRQAPEAIGNAFNAMLARMHQIKKTGFNQEDETKINDVAKALATINVTLLDSEGNWRNMDKIYAEIAEKWGTMDAKQRAYIATTVAGTRQQNVFYALMNDMSKGIEGGSRAWELYTGAMEAAGTATEKYSIWQESVAAAQADLKNSLEELYATLQPTLIKGFYNTIASLVDGINRFGGTKTIIVGLAAALLGLAPAITKLGGVLAATKAAFLTHPIFMAATLAVGVVAGIGAIWSAMETSEEKCKKYFQAFEESQKAIGRYGEEQKKLNEIQEQLDRGFGLSNEQISEYNTLLDDIAKTSPAAKKIVDDLRKGIINQKDAFILLNEELDKTIAKQKTLSKMDARDALKKATIDDDSWNMAPRSLYDRLMSEPGLDQVYDLTKPSDIWEYLDLSRWSGVLTGTQSGNDEKRLFNLVKYLEKYKDDTYDTFESALDDYFDAQKIQEEDLKEKVKGWIDTALVLVDQELNATQRGALQDAILNHVLLPDSGEINIEALEGFGSYLINNINQLADADHSKEIVNRIFSEMFGMDNWQTIFPASMLEQIEFITNSPDLAKGLEQAYTSLIEKGLTGPAIQGVVGEAVEDLFEQIETMTGERVQSLSDILEGWLSHLAPLGEDESLADYFGLGEYEWEEETLILISNQNAAGYSLEELRKKTSDTKSIAEFIAKLKELGQAASEAASGGDGSKGGGSGDDDTAGGLKGLIQRVEAIKKAEEAIEKIKSPTKNEYDKAKAWESLLGIFPELSTDSTIQDAIAALKKYIEETEKEAQELGEVGRSIMSGNVTAQKTTEQFTEDIDKAVQNAETIKTALSKVASGQPLELADFEALAKIDESVWNYIGSLDALEEKLKSMEATQEDAWHKAYKDWGVNDPMFFNISPFKTIETQMEGITTLQEYMDSMTAKGDKSKIMDAVIWITHLLEILKQPSQGQVASPLSNLIKDLEKLEKVQKALDTIKNKDSSPKDIAEAWKTQFDEFKQLNKDSSIEDAEQAINGLVATTKQAAEDAGEVGKTIVEAFNQKGTVKTIKDYVDEIAEASTKIDNVQSLIKSVDQGNMLTISDVLGIAESHPEILTLLSDMDALKEKLQEIKAEEESASKQKYFDMILNDKNVFAGSSMAATGAMVGATTFKEMQDYYGSDAYKRSLSPGLVAGMGFDTFKEAGIKKVADAMEELWKQLMHLSDPKELQGLDLLITQMDKLAKARQALETIKSADSSQLDTLNAWKTLIELFPELDVNSSIEDVTASMQQLEQEAGKTAASCGEAGKAIQQMGTTKGMKEFVSDLENARGIIEKINSILETLRGNKMPKLSELLNLATTHPEILAVMGDQDKLKAKLREIEKEEQGKEKQSLRDLFLNSKEFFGESNYAGLQAEELGVTTFKELMDWLAKENPGDEALSELNAYLDEYVDRVYYATTGTNEWAASLSKLREDTEFVIAHGTHEKVGEFMQENYQRGNVDLLNRPKVRTEDGSYMTLDSRMFFAGSGFGDESSGDYHENVIIHVTPILKDGTVLDEKSLNEYIQELIASGDIENADKNGKGLVTWLQTVEGDFDEAIAVGDEFDETLHNLQETYYGESSLKGFAEQAAESIRQSKAEITNYQEYVDQLQRSLESGFVDDPIAMWDTFDEKIQEGITKQFPELVIALENVRKAAEAYGKAEGDMTKKNKDAAAALSTFQRYLNNITKNNAARYFNSTADAIAGLYKGTVNVTDAYETFNKQAEKAVKAQYEFKTATANMAKGIEVASNDVSTLADFLNLDPTWMIEHWSQIGPILSEACAEGEDALNRLNEAAFIHITGSADVDFSDLINGLVTTEGLTKEVIQALNDTGQFTTETRELDNLVWVFENGRYIQKILKGLYQVIVPTGNNPLRGTYRPRATRNTNTNTNRNRGSGTGGGGSSNADRGPSEAAQALDYMEQVQGLYDERRNLYKAQQDYYSQTGELQGVILYMKKEGEAILGQNKLLEQNIAELEKWIEQKRAELSSLARNSEEYQEVASDLQNLQKRHQDYTKQLIDNKTAIDRLNKAIKEQNDAIRNMEIELRNTILQAIEDREALNDRMLQGTITTENTILDLIQKRYEKERDLILENTQKQIDALKEERDLLSEQLQLRKEQQEIEDKATKLAELEAQYARIIADPTRRNEALNIQKQINDMRKDMSWDTAERELKNQQEAIDNQISTLEDYVEYVNKYYEELFAHPQKLIAEMKAVIVQANADILQWLMDNSEEFANATEATQQSMIKNWENMLMDMHGEIKTYWEEVESIIAQGDEAIIKFLAENSADYKKASSLQAQAYVQGWMEQLQKLALAHKAVAEAQIGYNYAVWASAYGASVRSGAGGGVGGGYSGTGTATPNGVQSNLQSNLSSSPNHGIPGAAATALNMITGVIGAHYDTGGLASYTGLAWLDGSPEAPERVLSPKQTSLFESLVQSMEALSKVNVPSLPSFGNDFKSGSNAVSVGDIILNIDKLESDEDYDAIAERVFETIMEKMNRGAVIGGIRF